jgi:hypothetical protein
VTTTEARTAYAAGTILLVVGVVATDAAAFLVGVGFILAAALGHAK